MENHGETPDDKENCEKYRGYFFSTTVHIHSRHFKEAQYSTTLFIFTGAFTLPLLVSNILKKELETTNLGEQYLLQ